MLEQIHNLWDSEDGQDLIEYALLLAFVSLVVVALLTGIRSSIRTLWTDINNSLSNAVVSAS
ncbi:MAG: Flp family type IVb pilin [Acidobacteriaceae bacterium]|nr:Flp family type IVb pilin [Acidobacteriaceae bacterium]